MARARSRNSTDCCNLGCIHPPAKAEGFGVQGHLIMQLQYLLLVKIGHCNPLFQSYKAIAQRALNLPRRQNRGRRSGARDSVHRATRDSAIP